MLKVCSNLISPISKALKMDKDSKPVYIFARLELLMRLPRHIVLISSISPVIICHSWSTSKKWLRSSSDGRARLEAVKMGKPNSMHIPNCRPPTLFLHYSPFSIPTNPFKLTQTSWAFHRTFGQLTSMSQLHTTSPMLSSAMTYANTKWSKDRWYALNLSEEKVLIPLTLIVLLASWQD